MNEHGSPPLSPREADRRVADAVAEVLLGGVVAGEFAPGFAVDLARRIAERATGGGANTDDVLELLWLGDRV